VGQAPIWVLPRRDKALTVPVTGKHAAADRGHIPRCIHALTIEVMARQRLLTSLCVMGLLVSAISARFGPAAAADNAIIAENQQPGSSAWQLGSLITQDVNGEIKGYGSATSVLVGGSLNIYVSVNPSQTYTIDVYRIGWYGGLGGRLRLHAGPITGATQPACPADATTGMIACNWALGYTVAIPGDWTSGVYMAVLTNAAGYQNYVVFVVRDGRAAPFLYQHAVNTDEAYNNYPNDHATGKSLYDYNSFGANTVSGTPRAVKVSFDRPFANNGAGLFLNWEIQLVRWMERSGYDVTYSTDVDTHANGSDLLNHKAFLSTGHNEYWSSEMFNAAESARDAGVNLAFFGADTAYRQVRLEASAAGVPNRVVVFYKTASLDPVQGATTTTQFRDAPVNRPEQPLVSVEFTGEVSWGNNAPYVVTNSSNWVYNGTGFHDGDAVPGIVGYEMDHYATDNPAPTATSRTLLSQSPFTNSGGTPDYANSSIYQAPSGAWVFASGTMSWSWGVDSFDNAGIRTGVPTDARIQQTTANILNAFQFGPGTVHDLKVTAPATVRAGQAFSVSVTAESPQGNPVPTYSGTVHFSSTDTASGVVLPPDSTLTNGQGTFSVTLARAGPQTVTVSDAANALSTTVSLTVSPAPAGKFVLASGTTTSTAGNSFSFTVTAQDPFGNTDPSYAGRVHFTSSDTSTRAKLPADSTLTNGQGTFAATLVTVGSRTITGTDTASVAITGTLSVRITAAEAAILSLTAPSSAVINQPFTVTVTLKDRFGNTATGYTGTVYFSTSDLVAQQLGKMPADYPFSGADAGTHAFTVRLMTPPSQTITVTDTSISSLSAASPPIAVNAI